MTDISIPALDGTGTFGGYMAEPDSVGQVPGLILIQEIFGVNKVMRDWCNLFAKQGFLAVCPDLFWRQKPGIQLTDHTQEEWKQAIAYMNSFNLDKGIEDLKSTLSWLRQQPRCTGKVGTVGFCLGGKLAVLMSTRTDTDVSVSYYGVGLEDYVGEYGSITKPLMLHVAELDTYATPELRAKYDPAFRANPHVQYHLYPGVSHAFARQGGENYNAEAARLANNRTSTFLHHHLKG
jgi:carboxymethylenebutenolidase